VTTSPAPNASNGAGSGAALPELIRADQPTGTGPQIALRFLQALQTGNHVAAALELLVGGRAWLAADGAEVLHAVMRDVASNARLDDAAPCTGATRLNTEAAVVRCGQTNVVVHVLDDEVASGVQIAPWHPRWDMFRAPHTHAFTTFAP
jgi:hypothetical protein